MSLAPRPANKRNDILREASSLFAIHGYEGTSIRNIAGACSITEAAIYRHYESKSHLYNEVIKAKAAQHDIGGFLETLNNGDTLESLLMKIADHILSISSQDPHLMRLMSYCCLGSGEGGTTLFEEIRLPYIRFLTNSLSTRVASGEVRSIDPFITSRCFVGMVMDCALNADVWANIFGKSFSARDVVSNNVPIFARGLLTDGGKI
jgi:AcrR family transcriptional regulator